MTTLGTWINSVREGVVISLKHLFNWE
jgi:hypothetical protein